MKWVLVVIVLNTPVKTDVTFDSLKGCLNHEESMRHAWALRVNEVTE